MLSLNLNQQLEHTLNVLAESKQQSIENVIADAIAIYLEYQEDLACLAKVKEREQEETLNHAEFINALKEDGII